MTKVMLQYQKVGHFWVFHTHLAYPVPSQTTKVWDVGNILKNPVVTEAVVPELRRLK